MNTSQNQGGDDQIKSNVYKDDFISNDLFWGIGIEHETYLVCSKNDWRKTSNVFKNTKRERYSVDYNLSFRNSIRELYLPIQEEDLIPIPIYISSHALTKTDKNKEHRTLYLKVPIPNPKFSQKSILDELSESDPYFLNHQGFGKDFVFDGDTIEFTTRNFYKTNIQDCIHELIEKEDRFIEHIDPIWNKIGLEEKYGKLSIPKLNYGLTSFWTNPTQTALCNNGTYHFNITIPTELDDQTNLVNEADFKHKHLQIISFLQWMEPFLVATYGTPDIFGIVSEAPFAHGSQRVSLSRYISMGTFDISNPLMGKILTMEASKISFFQNPDWWLNRLKSFSGYQYEGKEQYSCFGFDFNIEKHRHLGIEFRIFDAFPSNLLEDVLQLILLMIDFSLLSKKSIFPVAGVDPNWNEIAYQSSFNGSSGWMNVSDIKKYEKILSVEKDKKKKYKKMMIYDFFVKMVDHMYDFVEKRGFGPCYQNMTKNKSKPKLVNWNRQCWEEMFMFYLPNNKKECKRYKKYEEIWDGLCMKWKGREKDFINVEYSSRYDIRLIYLLESEKKIKIRKIKSKKSLFEIKFKLTIEIL
jgi:hypothetical protein